MLLNIPDNSKIGKYYKIIDSQDFNNYNMILQDKMNNINDIDEYYYLIEFFNLIIKKDYFLHCNDFIKGKLIKIFEENNTIRNDDNNSCLNKLIKLTPKSNNLIPIFYDKTISYLIDYQINPIPDYLIEVMELLKSFSNKYQIVNDKMMKDLILTCINLVIFIKNNSQDSYEIRKIINNQRYKNFLNRINYDVYLPNFNNYILLSLNNHNINYNYELISNIKLIISSYFLYNNPEFYYDICNFVLFWLLGETKNLEKLILHMKNNNIQIIVRDSIYNDDFYNFMKSLDKIFYFE